MTRLVIIGGSDAGIAAALRAAELDPDAEITVLLADAYPNFSICGLPYFISGTVSDWRSLAHRTSFPGIEVRRGHRVTRIDPEAKRVTAVHDGREAQVGYDKLVIATGATPRWLEIPGADLPGVHVLHTMEDAFSLRDAVESGARRAVIAGAGYIGLEMAEALVELGLAVTMLSHGPSVMPGVDTELGEVLHGLLRCRGVTVRTNTALTRIHPGLIATDSTGQGHPADLVLLATGVRPEVTLAASAGAGVGKTGAIAVTPRMETTVPDVFAAGDCAETLHRLLPTPTWISLGTIAHKQGRVAGENAVGGEREFAGIVGTQSLKLFERVVARTGLADDEARRAGFDPLTVSVTTDDHKAYMPGATPLIVRVTGDRSTGRLLGAQMLGRHGAEVSKRIDVFAAALHHGATVEQLNDLDLSYTPPLAAPWDVIQQAAQAWPREARSSGKPAEAEAGTDRGLGPSARTSVLFS